MLPRSAFLGVELPGDDETFVDGGMRIVGVHAGGMAEHAGLAAGDLVRSLAGIPLSDLVQLAVALRRAGDQPAVEIVFERSGRTRAVRAGVIARPEEPLPDVVYGELEVEGARLRTIATGVDAARALIFVIQGIACESIDLATTPDAPLASLVAAWAAAGVDSLRFDKRGVGDSTGEPCRDVDFAGELADTKAALGRARELARSRDVPLIVFGHSVGGIIAAVLAGEPDITGVIVYGTPATSWLDCLRDSTRRQLELRGASPADIARRVAALDELVRAGELNGRTAGYHAQLAALDLEAAWRAVACPLLVVRGEYDWVVRADDQARIATLASGPTTIVDLPQLDHLYGWHDSHEASLRDYGGGVAHPAVAEATLAWLDRLHRRSSPV